MTSEPANPTAPERARLARLASTLNRIAALPFILVILLYQATLSPLLGGQCRFEPTCSRYGLEAYRRFGALGGTWLTTWRLLRCQPFGRGGYDPVPIDPPRPLPEWTRAERN